ncbi:hypothetical protein SDC9_115348 [bioreactor metagenome]|uniref:Uncharacterized protein n=1 Tax=bioreactor metagenome TaxID=1076179 RepID=A0A645BSR4_9ZZZZ
MSGHSADTMDPYTIEAPSIRSEMENSLENRTSVQAGATFAAAATAMEAKERPAVSSTDIII